MKNMHIPLVASSSILGSLKTYVADPVQFLAKNQEALGDIFAFRVAHRKITYTARPEHIQQILQSNNKRYKKSVAYTKLKLLLGEGLFTSEGEFWLRQRRLAQPAFHRQQIEGYGKDIVQLTEEAFAEWEGKQQVDLLSEMTNLTLNIISKTLLGIQLQDEGALIEQQLPFALRFMIKRITSSVNPPMVLPTANNRQFKHAVNTLNRMITKLIADKRQQTQPANDLLTTLIHQQEADTGDRMNDLQLRDEVMTFFLAGHETTAVTAIWTIILLSQNPASLTKLSHEINTYWDDQLPVTQVVNQLNYLDLVIKESMRIYSPVWVLGREALADNPLEPYTLKKGSGVIFSPFLIHRNPEFWPDPLQFKPERFEQEPAKYTYFPFGGGPRLCIGNNFALLELKIILAKLIRRFDFALPQDFKPQFDFSLTLRPKEEIKLHITPLTLA